MTVISWMCMSSGLRDSRVILKQERNQYFVFVFILMVCVSFVFLLRLTKRTRLRGV